jgi:hypothetical protein
MKKNLLIIFILMLTGIITGFAQTDSFGVFTYQAPDFFTKTNLSDRLQFFLANKDGSFCNINLYKTQPAKDSVIQDVRAQWNEYVLKPLSRADKKPARIYTEQTWDGWVSTVAIGNFYQNKKKCVVMLHSFRKARTTTCVLYAFSDKNFKGVVDKFSKNLHLIQ